MPRGKMSRPRGSALNTAEFGDLEVENVEPELSQGYSIDYKGREIICWDGEGMNLSGPDKPQHYVLFGCSAAVDAPLTGRKLRTGQLLNYMCDVAAENPRAVHVAYSFKYDFNMIIQDLTWLQKLHLKNDGKVTVDKGWAFDPKTWGYRYYISYIPGKIFKVLRLDLDTGEKTRIRIDDVFSFFARKFLVSVESILGDELSEHDRQIIAAGKEERGNTVWEDMPRVLEYWQSEIVMMQRMMVKFRDVMYRAGFKLKQWYGPGAIATYLIQTKKLKNHIQNTPSIPEVHNASKHAYAGGRFELFQIGRVQGPVYGYDINSAYPHAMSNAPSLGLEHGNWEYHRSPDGIAEFGIYHISFEYGTGVGTFLAYGAMPLFHRDTRGAISYPTRLEGWYWSPEARIAKRFGERFGGVVFHEAWVWNHDGNYPFKFMEEMFNERLALGKKNVISMPYKLGPNSMYGKFAQRVGSNGDDPPASHCLPLAGWVTSQCRARLYTVMMQIPIDKLIAVETDGIYTTVPPESLRLDIGDGLGQWGIDRYDEMLYLQNGIYHRRRGENWEEPKSRGLDVASVPLARVRSFLQEAGPGEFPTLTVKMKNRFTGLSAALVGDPETVSERHCVWVPGEREIAPGGKGKRVHLPKACPACHAGKTAWDASHPLVIRSTAGLNSPLMSQPHVLPWERVRQYEAVKQARIQEEIEADLL